jgi:hypothetical protein
MIDATMNDRLAGLGLRPAFAVALSHLLAVDVSCLAQHPPVVATFATLAAVLQTPDAVLSPFRTAWTLMYATIGRLDSLQDGDPIVAPPQVPSIGAHYNLVFASYILATSLLDDLVEEVPAARLLRLQRWWSDCMLRMADGQQHDLESGAEPRSFDALAVYQQIAQAKTGATYALAFGGLAMLLTEDDELVASLTQVGEIFGTLVQYADDLRDAASQPNPALTLPELLPFLPLDTPHQLDHIASAFWSYLYPTYLQAAVGALSRYPSVHGQIAAMFAEVFAA